MNFNRNIKILITGATGFLGYRLAIKLQEENYDVYAIGRNSEIGKKLEYNNIKFINLDITNREKLIEASKNMNFIFHCAAKSSLWGTYEDFYNANVIGTKNIIEACKKNKIKRLIHVSTPSIYFDFKDKLDIKENTELPKKFVNYYAQTKFLAEKEVDNAFKDGLEVITIRPRAIIGKGDTSIIPRLLKANKEKFIPKTRKEDIIIDVTHVDNVVHSLLLCMNADNSCLGQKYNITNGEPIQLYNFMGKILKEMNEKLNVKDISYTFLYVFSYITEFVHKFLLKNKEPIFTRYSLGLLTFNQTLNIEKAKRELGYKPIKTIEECIKEYSN